MGSLTFLAFIKNFRLIFTSNCLRIIVEFKEPLKPHPTKHYFRKTWLGHKPGLTLWNSASRVVSKPANAGQVYTYGLKSKQTQIRPNQQRRQQGSALVIRTVLRCGVHSFWVLGYCLSGPANLSFLRLPSFLKTVFLLRWIVVMTFHPNIYPRHIDVIVQS